MEKYIKPEMEVIELSNDIIVRSCPGDEFCPTHNYEENELPIIPV